METALDPDGLLLMIIIDLVTGDTDSHTGSASV